MNFCIAKRKKGTALKTNKTKHQGVSVVGMIDNFYNHGQFDCFSWAPKVNPLSDVKKMKPYFNSDPVVSS